MKVTIKDVAREANVATSTVSRVLSNNNRISEETKKRVNDAIKKLNYTPNIIARGLANKKTRILAVVLPECAEDLFSNPFFVQALKGISLCAQKENYYIMYAFKEENEDDEKWMEKFTGSNLVDGICLLRSNKNDGCIQYLRRIDFPFSIIGRPENTEGILWVDNDNFESMYGVVQKLIDRGYKEIGFIGAKSHLNVSKDRLNGYREALISRGIDINEKIIIQEMDFSQQYGYKAAKELLKREVPKAIVATDDLLAFGVQRALKELERNEVSIVGFNNIPLAKYQNPSLTSVDINAEKLGYYATQLLIDKLESKSDGKNHCIIETKLIERDSTH